MGARYKQGCAFWSSHTRMEPAVMEEGGNVRLINP